MQNKNLSYENCQSNGNRLFSLCNSDKNLNDVHEKKEFRRQISLVCGNK